LIEEEDILTQSGRDRATEGFAQEAEALAGTASGGAAVDAADTTADLQSANAPAPSMAQQPPADMDGNLALSEAGEAGEADFDDEAMEMDEEMQAEPMEARSSNPIQNAGGKTFIQLDSVWTDTLFEPDTMQTTEVIFLSDEYFDLLTEFPHLADAFALSDSLIIVIEGTAYQVVPEA